MTGACEGSGNCGVGGAEWCRTGAREPVRPAEDSTAAQGTERAVKNLDAAVARSQPSPRSPPEPPTGPVYASPQSPPSVCSTPCTARPPHAWLCSAVCETSLELVCSLLAEELPCCALAVAAAVAV